jgi:hypothetical protein
VYFLQNFNGILTTLAKINTVTPKRKILKVDPFDDIHIIGINTTHRDYKLAWYLNEYLKTDFSKLDDIELHGQEGELLLFPFYYYNAGENLNVYNLIGNRSNGHIFTRLSLQTDYFLIIRNYLHIEKLALINQQIKQIPNVMLAYRVDAAKEKSIDLMLEEVELHEFKTLRSAKARLPRSAPSSQ